MFLRLAIHLVICFLSGAAAAHPGGVDKGGCHKESPTGARHCHAERASRAEKKPTFNRERPPRAGDEGVFYGPLVSVVDGDTLKARVQGVVMTFRLQGIDAPEHDQPYGSTATAALREITREKDLVLVFSDVDPYGRIVVQAWVGNVDVNQEMVRRGAAWFDAAYSDDQQLYLIENGARSRKVGLWALRSSERVEPWVWRKEKR